MTPLSILVDSDTPIRSRALAASLPATVALSRDAGDLVLVDAGDDWTERLCDRMASGGRRFLVLDPVVPTAGRLDRAVAMADETASHVAIGETIADNPAVEPFRASLAGPYTTVTITGHGSSSIADLLLQQLRLARRTGFESPSVVHAACDDRAALVTLRVSRDGAPALLRLSATVSMAGSPRHRLMAHAPAETACLEIGSEAIARPACAFRVTEDGETVLPTIYETAHRAVLRSLAREPGDGGSPSDLRAWHEDATLATALAAR